MEFDSNNKASERFDYKEEMSDMPWHFWVDDATTAAAMLCGTR